MLWIQGNKVACQPCIRGHRSTKCFHSDRVLTPVRKPGRPLSSCTCAADHVSGDDGAGIGPWKQTCRCPLALKLSLNTSVLAAAGLHPVANDSQLSPLSPLPSPASATSHRAGYRPPKTAVAVAKPAGKRKRALEPRPVGENGATVPVKIETAEEQCSGLEAMSRKRSRSSIHSSEAEITSQPEYSPSEYSTPYHDAGLAALYSDFSLPARSPSAAGSQASCRSTDHVLGEDSLWCSTSRNIADASRLLQSASSSRSGTGPDDYYSSSDFSSESGSLFSSRSASLVAPSIETLAVGNQRVALDTITQTVQPSADDHPTVNFPAGEGFEQYGDRPHSVFAHFFDQPTAFKYASPDYDSLVQPPRSHEWRQMIEDADSGSLATDSFRVASPALSLSCLPDRLNGVPSATGSMVCKSDECTGGVLCQCVGCPTHPFNEATQYYVKSAWNYLLARSSNTSTESSYPSRSNSVEEEATSRSATSAATSLFGHDSLAPQQQQGSHPHQHPQHGCVDDAGPPLPHAQTPESEACAEERSVPASEFFFVSYPFDGEECGGETGICPCSDDCHCLGCAMHSGASLDV